MEQLPFCIITFCWAFCTVLHGALSECATWQLHSFQARVAGCLGLFGSKLEGCGAAVSAASSWFMKEFFWSAWLTCRGI